MARMRDGEGEKDRTFAEMATRWTWMNAYKSEPGLMDIGVDLFEGEELIMKLYEIFVSLIATGWEGGQKGIAHLDVSDVGIAYFERGFYIPCVRRVVLTGEVDFRSDGLPTYGSIVQFEKNDIIFWSTARLSKLPIGVVQPSAGTPYRTCMMERKKSNKGSRSELGKDIMSTIAREVYVNRFGHVMPCVNKQLLPNSRATWASSAWCAMTSVMLNAAADSRYLWNVKTEELVASKTDKTPILLGVGEEHVKSLFYARSGPITAAGRKRPILHWVEAHRRRLERGIDVDVRKHLRGIAEFEMEGLPFAIVSPTKGKGDHGQA